MLLTASLPRLCNLTDHHLMWITCWLTLPSLAQHFCLVNCGKMRTQVLNWWPGYYFIPIISQDQSVNTVMTKLCCIMFYSFSAINKGVYYLNKNQTGLQILSPDVALLTLGTASRPPSVFPVPLTTPTEPFISVAYNIYNNMWNTNYIYWYPFFQEDQNFKARFYVNFVWRYQIPAHISPTSIK